MLKKIKWLSIMLALIYIAGGILSLLYPVDVENALCLIFGVVFIFYGIVNILNYFMMDLKQSLYRNDFAMGTLKIMIGIMVIYFRYLFQDLTPYMLAMAIIMSGFTKLQDGIDAGRIGYPKVWLYVIMALISIVLGFVVMFYLPDAAGMTLQIAGAALLYCGVTDLYSALYLSGKIRKYMKSLEEDEQRKKKEREKEEKPEINAGIDEYTNVMIPEDQVEEVPSSLHETLALPAQNEALKDEETQEIDLY